MNYFIGIDNSSLNHKVKIIDEESNQKHTFSIQNNIVGFNELNKELAMFQNVKIGFEIPHGPLVDYLHLKKYNIYS